MMPDPTLEPGAFAAAFAALYTAHQVADHWVQTRWQAATKAEPGWLGRLACAAHVGTYTLTAMVLLATTIAATGMHADPLRIALGLLLSAVTHYLADRRAPLIALAEWVGRIRFYAYGIPRPGRDDNPSLGTGAYALDQSFHLFFLFFAALWIA
jgi:hypothetical protein